jgi:hypothetical protein
MNALGVNARPDRTAPALLVLSAIFLYSSVEALATPVVLSDLVRNGEATLIDSGNTLRLLPNSNPGGAYTMLNPPASSAWYPTPLQVRDGFMTSFQFRMWDPAGTPDPADGSGADGFAFVIQNDPQGSAALGRGAGGLGYMYINDSAALEFDTYQNAPWYSDPDGNHISLHSRGTSFNVPHHRCSGGLLTNAPSAYTDMPNELCTADPDLGSTSGLATRLDGAPHTATIIYVPGTFSVYLDSGATPVLTIAVDLNQKLQLPSDGAAYVGFTAGTMGGFQNHDLLSWDYGRVPEPATWLLAGTALVLAGLWRRIART